MARKIAGLEARFKSLDAYKRYYVYYVYSPQNWFPCISCQGRGWEYTGRPDPVEGNKMRDQRACAACAGTGEGPKEVFKALYESERATRVQELYTRKRLLKVYKELMKELTQDQKDAIRMWG